MAKTEKKNHSELKLLRERIRDLEKENRTLKRRLRQYEKRNDLYEDNREEIQEIISRDLEENKIEFVKKLTPCDACGKGEYEEFEILSKVFGTCNTCGDRKKLR